MTYEEYIASLQPPIQNDRDTQEYKNFENDKYQKLLNPKLKSLIEAALEYKAKHPNLERDINVIDWIDPQEKRKYADEKFISPFGKKGDIKKKVKDIYRILRGIANIDEEGNLIATRGAKYFGGLGQFYLGDPVQNMHNTVEERALHKEHIIPYEKESFSYMIPRELVRKIDPYYKDYNTSLKQLFEGIDNLDDRTKTRIGEIMNLKALKNISKSTNKQNAFKEIKEFLDDFHIQTAKYGDTFDSLNQIRDYTNLLNQRRDENARQHAIGDLANDMLTEQRLLNGQNEYENFYNDATKIRKKLKKEHAQTPVEDIKNLSREYNNRIEQYKYDHADEIERARIERARIERAQEEERRRKEIELKHTPFEYSNDILESVENTNWTLPATHADLEERGKQMSHCVGGYGPRVRNHDCIILTKGDSTAEIQFNIDKKKGIITQAFINQVKGPHNRLDKPDDELDYIAAELVGKSINNIDNNDALENEISDIFMKHLIKPTNIVNALNRRFI
jgi:hypothetical protein